MSVHAFLTEFKSSTIACVHVFINSLLVLNTLNMQYTTTTTTTTAAAVMLEALCIITLSTVGKVKCQYVGMCVLSKRRQCLTTWKSLLLGLQFKIWVQCRESILLSAIQLAALLLIEHYGNLESHEPWRAWVSTKNLSAHSFHASKRLIKSCLRLLLRIIPICFTFFVNIVSLCLIVFISSLSLLSFRSKIKHSN